MTIEVDERLKAAIEVWDKLSEASQDSIKDLIKTGKMDYYQGSYDALSSVHIAFNTSPEHAKQACSRLVILAYLILNHEDLNLLDQKRIIN